MPGRPALGEERVQRSAVVLETGLFAPYREAHVALLGGDPELVEQAREERIRAFVVDDKARIDVVAPAGAPDFAGVGMAPT